MDPSSSLAYVLQVNMYESQEQGILTGDNVQEGIRDAAGNRIPHLPVEIFGVIMEHLIGQHAFGTAANVNIISKAVRGETSPILWETVIIERAYDNRWCTVLPSNMKYTKFPFIQSVNLPLLASADVLPNLVMAVRYNNSDSGWECVLSVFKRISMGSVVTLLGTPLRHPETDHGLCLYRSNAQLYPAEPQRELLAECIAVGVPPRVRPVEVISGVHLHDDGVIYGDIPERLRWITTSVRLYHTSLIESYNHASDIHTGLCETAIQLLKLHTMQSRSAEGAIWEVPVRSPRGVHGCLFARGIPQWDLTFNNLAEEAVELFVHKFENEARLTPKILQNAIQTSIFIDGGVPRANPILPLLKRFHDIYVAYLPLPPQVRHLDSSSRQILSITVTKAYRQGFSPKRGSAREESGAIVISSERGQLSISIEYKQQMVMMHKRECKMRLVRKRRMVDREGEGRVVDTGRICCWYS